ncbi:DNA-directed RNA polymerase subunit beta [candidate division KSB1 bacterium 4484_87]|nr:MAG: DNA-directed RNA polymerase subunit beta [candidate division KSB1 bacterium 4484_87]
MQKTKRQRKSFSKIQTIVDLPDLLNIQLESFKEFVQPDVPPEKRENKGLQAVFNSIFPIEDSRENFVLDFISYYLEKPKYSVDECQERGNTYAAPLKAKLRLSIRDPESDSGEIIDSMEQTVYLGNIPMMTEKGTFIINGAERIVVSQLHRSPGAFFDEMKHPNDTKIYSARIIPLRGSWLEFVTDINDVMYFYIDRRKKFPVTTLLRAIGYSTDREIYELFDMVEEVGVDDKKIESYFGKTVLMDVIDYETGEILLEKDSTLDQESLANLRAHHIEKVKFVKSESPYSPEIINNTIRKDPTKSEKEALEMIYRHLRSGDAPDLETARNLVFRFFFNPKRYDLGEVGRYRLNNKLGLSIDPDVTVLTKEDIIAIINYLLDLRNGKIQADDIDHLGNRRIKTVGEQLAAQMSVGLSRLARTVKERMNLRDNEELTPQDLVNARTILSVINTFFGTSQLSQFMDQTNPLAEMTHKRRLSALGPGGLTRERAGFEVRDVHYTHYGRLCPIETPEGPNIGLISSLTTFGRINKLGFIETPYRKVVDGRVTDEIHYLSADDEENLRVAQANAPIDEKGNFINDRVQVRFRGDFPLVTPKEVDYMDVSPTQMVSAAASLIPFLEHDDANRALMGSNMQRQSVPLLKPEAPIVGTGVEAKVALDSRAMIVCRRSGVVERVDATKIVVRADDLDADAELNVESLLDFDSDETDVYPLQKFKRSNQDTCTNQIPLVREGDRVQKGDVLADGCATEGGELALGRNVLVAFMPWRGYNFEDAIVISERVVQEDVYTSIHIEVLETQVRDTKRGEEELTREIPNVSEEATKDLDENGIIRVGAEVHEGDILVGKVTPKGETDPTPEEKLLKAIFGEKAGDVKDASLKAPTGLHGTVIATKLFSRKKRDAKNKRLEKKELEKVEKWYTAEKQRIKRLRDKKLRRVLLDQKSAGISELDGGKVVVRAKTVLKKDLLENLDFDALDLTRPLVDDAERNELVAEILEQYYKKLDSLQEDYENQKFKVTVGDELPPGIVQMAKVYVAKKRKLMIGDKMAGRHGNKGVVATIVPVEDMPFLPDGTPVDIVLNPLGVPSRMNLGQIMETSLGWAGKILDVMYSTPVFDGASLEEVQTEMEEAGLPRDGKSILFDGRTGEQFDNPVTIGFIYIMKLSHLVEDKIHARSIGPYSLITQQPLGGKAQFGGQRFGEMEVWALEAYGAAHTLQEILTVKSDDVRGRSKAYEAIVKGESLPDPGVPESFNVLIRELMGLGLDVELLNLKDEGGI